MRKILEGKNLKNKINLMGNNDILNITNKEIIYKIHTSYLESGADILETNTFNSTIISQKDYGCENYSYELNYEGGVIARKAVDDYLKKILRKKNLLLVY